MIAIINKSENNLAYQTVNSAGFDIPANEWLILQPEEVRLIHTGLYIDVETTLKNKRWFLEKMGFPHNALGFNFELVIRSRSSICLKNKVFVLNQPATIDIDYPSSSEIKVMLYNLSSRPFEIKKGDRIAQGVANLITKITTISVKDKKRTGGFGSTGK